MAEHRNLTGASLHEPKGVESATSGTVYHANGAGSGSWTNPLTPIKNLNVFAMTGQISDVSAAGSNYFFYIPDTCSLTTMGTVLYGAIITADSILTFYKNGVLQAPTHTIPFAGSGVGVVSTKTFSPTLNFVIGDTLEVRSDGGSANVVPLSLTMIFAAT